MGRSSGSVFLSLCFAVFATAFVGSQVMAQSRSANVKANRSFVYHGKLVRPDGTLPEGSMGVTLKIQSPEPSICLLWAEAQTVVLKDGSFSLEIGYEQNRIAGVNGGAAADFSQVFINNTALTIASAQCAQGTAYTPTMSDDRLLSATFNDSGKVIELTGLPIKSVPYALQAEQINGFGLSNLMKISGSGSPVTFTPAETASLKDLLGADLNWDFKGRQLTNVADPIAATDAANRGWVLAHVSSQISTFGGTTISSIGFTAPASLFSVSGSPMTANGSIDLTLNNQNANQVFAGPASGGAAAPAFRGLAPADIPALDAGKITTGTFTASQIPALDASKITTGVLDAVRGGTGIAPSMANANKVLGLDASGSNTEYKAITAGANVTITPSAGGIQISSSNPGGTVSSVTSANAYLGVTNGSSTPNLTLNVGSIANTVAAGDDTRFPSATCAVGSRNRWSGTAWVCETDIDTNSGGTVTTVTSANSYLSVTNGSSTPNLTLNVGSAVNTVAAGNDSRFPSATCAVGSRNRWNGSAWVCEVDIDTDTNSGGTVTAVSVGGLPLSVTNGSSTPQISIAQANTTTAGFLSATDWNTFNNKQPAGAYLTGITSGQVTTALGYTPVNKAGDTMTGNLAFSATNPTITSGGSYITIPNGLYVSGGIPYFQTEIQARGGIGNDNAAYLQLDGGTSGVTYVNGALGVGTSSPNAAAILDLSSTTKGFMPPRVTTAQRDAIASASSGLVVYNSSTNKLQFHNGTAWGDVDTSGGGGGGGGIDCSDTAAILQGSASRTVAQCTAAGGVATPALTGCLCKFTAASCPGGWTWSGSWSVTTAKSCPGTGCNTVPCTTGAHGWGDVTTESCSYFTGANMVCSSCNGGGYTTCTANRTAVGCY